VISALWLSESVVVVLGILSSAIAIVLLGSSNTCESVFLVRGTGFSISSLGALTFLSGGYPMLGVALGGLKSSIFGR
jgi:hypothetical protein